MRRNKASSGSLSLISSLFCPRVLSPSVLLKFHTHSVVQQKRLKWEENQIFSIISIYFFIFMYFYHSYQQFLFLFFHFVSLFACVIFFRSHALDLFVFLRIILLGRWIIISHLTSHQSVSSISQCLRAGVAPLVRLLWFFQRNSGIPFLALGVF